MTTRHALPGLMAGALGLAAGVLGYLTDEPFAGVIAGLFALAATATCVRLASRLEDEVLLRRRLTGDPATTSAMEGQRTGSDPASGPTDDAADHVADLVVASDGERTNDGGTAEEGAGGADRGGADPGGAGASGGDGDEVDRQLELELHVEPLVEPLVESLALPIDESAALADPETGLFNENFFHVVLENRIAAARRHLRPVAIVLLEVVHGLPRNEPAAVEPGGVADVLMETLREADTACRLHNGHFALLLEDTPETGAIWTVERIRRQLIASQDGVTVWAGIACYPAHALTVSSVLEAAEQALIAAREWRQDRIEVATAAD